MGKITKERYRNQRTMNKMKNDFKNMTKIKKEKRIKNEEKLSIYNEKNIRKKSKRKKEIDRQK